MEKQNFLLNNEDGSTIVLAMLILAVLTILGISSINTSSIELQIVHNEKIYQREFYVADSAWKKGVYWIDQKSKKPSNKNSPAPSTPSKEEEAIAKIVRNFGDGGKDVLNDDFSGNADDTIDVEPGKPVPYWYNVQFDKKDSGVPGTGPTDPNFIYIIKSNANGSQMIEVRVTKIFSGGGVGKY